MSRRARLFWASFVAAALTASCAGTALGQIAGDAARSWTGADRTQGVAELEGLYR